MNLVFFNSSLLIDVVAAPFFYLIPAGVGLFLLSSKTVRKMSHEYETTHLVTLIGLFAGLHFDAVLISFLEWAGLLSQSYSALIYVNLLVSFLGYSRWWSNLRQCDFFRNAFLNILWTSPLIAFLYFVSTFLYSDFPLRDIFQDVHFLKGAQEIANFKILNPFVADTYVPLIQTQLAFLQSIFRVDLFRVQWILPLFSVLVHSLCFLALISEFVSLRSRVAALALCVALISTFNVLTFNNSNLLSSLMIVLVAFVWRVQPLVPRIPSLLFASVVIPLLLWIFHVPFWAHFFIWLGVVAWVFLASSNFVLTFLVTSSFVGLGLHRTVLVYMVILGSLFLVRPLAYKYYRKVLPVIGTALALILSVASWVIIDRQSFKAFYIIIQKRVFELMSLVLNKTIDIKDPIEIGGGPLAPLNEYLRVSTPLFFLILFCLLFLFVRNLYFRRVTQDFERKILTCGALFFVSLILVVGPMPYWYRALMIPVVLGALGFSSLFWETIMNKSSKFFQIIFPLVVLYFSTVLFWAFEILKQTEAPRYPYLGLFLPVLAVLSVAMLLLFPVFGWFRTTGVRSVCTAIFVVLALTLDRVMFLGMFFNGSYGWQYPAPKTISHYSIDELTALNDIAPGVTLKSVFLSDGPMMSLAKARLGVSPLVNFTNIDLIPNGYKLPLARIILALCEGDSKLVRSELKKFTESHAGFAPEAKYIYEKHVGLDFRLENYESEIIFALTARSLEWAKAITSGNLTPNFYFPSREDLDSRILSKIMKNFELLRAENGKVLIFKFRELHQLYGSNET